MTQNCPQCGYFVLTKLFGDDRSIGVCRRFPPVARPMAEGLTRPSSFYQPVVSEHDGCGEFKHRSQDPLPQ